MKLWRACISGWVTSPANKLHIYPFQKGASTNPKHNLGFLPAQLLLPAPRKWREEIYSCSRQEDLEELQSCPYLTVGLLKPNPSPSGFSPVLTNPQQMPGAAVPGSAANSRDSLELKIGRCWRQLMLLLTVPSWVGYLQKSRWPGRNSSNLLPSSEKVPFAHSSESIHSISRHLVGKAGTVTCVERKPRKKTTNKLVPEQKQVWNVIGK